MKQGRFYWILVRSSTKDPECQPARFTGVVGAGATRDFIGFNSDVSHYFVEVIEIGPELTDGYYIMTFETATVSVVGAGN